MTPITYVRLRFRQAGAGVRTVWAQDAQARRIGKLPASVKYRIFKRVTSALGHHHHRHHPTVSLVGGLR